jgi:hypothetical protein
MKKYILLFVAGATLLSACSKGTNSTTNNTTVVPTSVLAYSVDGVHDVILQKDGTTYLPLTVNYHDSLQQLVTVNITGQPKFVDVYAYYTGSPYNVSAEGPWTGTPTFSIPLAVNSFYNDTSYVAGTYPLTLTATGMFSGTRVIKFNLICL